MFAFRSLHGLGGFLRVLSIRQWNMRLVSRLTRRHVNMERFYSDGPTRTDDLVSILLAPLHQSVLFRGNRTRKPLDGWPAVE